MNYIDDKKYNQYIFEYTLIKTIESIQENIHDIKVSSKRYNKILPIYSDICKYMMSKTISSEKNYLDYHKIAAAMTLSILICKPIISNNKGIPTEINNCNEIYALNTGLYLTILYQSLSVTKTKIPDKLIEKIMCLDFPFPDSINDPNMTSVTIIQSFNYLSEELKNTNNYHSFIWLLSNIYYFLDYNSRDINTDRIKRLLDTYKHNIG